MKVLSSPGVPVSKSFTISSMDLISTSPPAVHVKSGPPLTQQSNAILTTTSHTENLNINQRRWRSIFRRVQKKNMDSSCVSTSPKRPLFGQALSNVCEKDELPPKPIMDALTLLLKKGLETEGVFRKAGSAKHLKEIKLQLNEGIEVDLKDQKVYLLADLVKDFLRHLPGSLLIVEQYKTWMAAMEKQDIDEKCAEIKIVVNNLPEPNFQLLKHLIVLLHHIHENAHLNMMNSSNLATCVSPNLLQTDNLENMTEVTNLTQFLIENCCKIFGEEALAVFGDSDEDELSDNQDSHHHDSAYDSNDPDTDGYKGSYSDMDSIKSPNEEKSPGSTSAEEPWSAKLLIRRRSEPTFAFSQGVQRHLALTRSQTEMDFHDKLLTKQISDDCIILRGDNRLVPSLEKSCGFTVKYGTRPIHKDSSTSSLESCFSSASESSVHSSPLITSSNQRRALHRKHSFPTRQSTPAQNRSETPKRRSQSMKSAHIRSRTVFGRSGSTKRAIERTLRHSQTLPEVLNPQTSASSFCEPKRLSTEEIFQQVDSRIPGNPPSYHQALQDNSHRVLSKCGSLTVQDARSLSKQTSSRSTSPSAEMLDTPSGNETYNINRDDKETGGDIIMSGASSELRSSSETMYDASLPVRETYV